jgi:hypothetical protein
MKLRCREGCVPWGMLPALRERVPGGPDSPGCGGGIPMPGRGANCPGAPGPWKGGPGPSRTGGAAPPVAGVRGGGGPATPVGPTAVPSALNEGPARGGLPDRDWGFVPGPPGRGGPRMGTGPPGNGTGADKLPGAEVRPDGTPVDTMKVVHSLHTLPFCFYWQLE